MKFLVLLLLFSCAHKAPVYNEPGVKLPEVIIPPTLSFRKTPKYHLPPMISKEYTEAVALIDTWANSDEFWIYVMKKRNYFAHTTVSVPEAVRQFRNQLAQGDEIPVVFYTPWYSKAIGGWNGYKISQNTKFVFSPIDRAGHLLHETSHKYNWRHDGNYASMNDNLNSFPYAIGDDFRLFLTLRQLSE